MKNKNKSKDAGELNMRDAVIIIILVIAAILFVLFYPWGCLPPESRFPAWLGW